MEVGAQHRRIRWGINVIFRVSPGGLTIFLTEFVLDQHANLVQLSMFAVIVIDTYHGSK